MLALHAEQSCDINNWWMGEKFDGIRGCWNPNLRLIYSRQGKRINILEMWYKHMPSCFLDGELWHGRQLFALISRLPNILEENMGSIRWEHIKYIIFDSPSPEYTDIFFEKRYLYILGAVSPTHSFVIPSPRILCRNRKFMHRYANTIMKYGGEGVMLRQPASRYERGKSRALLKFKSMVDIEAQVTRIDGSKYTCKLPNGDVMTATKRLKLHVKVGSIVSFAKLQNNKIRHVKSVHIITKVRHDISWIDVINNTC